METNSKNTVKLADSISLSGLSELNYNNALYLCGGFDNLNGGKHFFKYVRGSKLELLANCIHFHKNPSLIQVEHKFIFCIGGDWENTHVEKYSLKAKKWETYAELPLGVHGATPYYYSSCLYLIGGFNNLKEAYLDYFLRLFISEDFPEKYNWEVLKLKKDGYMFASGIDESYLAKMNMGIIEIKSDQILLFGGKCFDENSAEVALVNFTEKTVKKETFQLNASAAFSSNAVYFSDGQKIYLYDDTAKLHMLDYSEKQFLLVNK